MTAPGPDHGLEDLARTTLGISVPEGHEPGTLDAPVRTPSNDPPVTNPEQAIPKAEPGPLTDIGARQKRSTGPGYTLTVTHHADDESLIVRFGPGATITEVKAWVAAEIHRAHADPPPSIAEETATAVDAFIARIDRHRGPLLMYDPFLETTVEIRRHPDDDPHDVTRPGPPNPGQAAPADTDNPEDGHPT